MDIITLKKWIEMQIEFLKSLQEYQTTQNIMSEHNIMIRCYQGVLNRINDLEEIQIKSEV